MEKDESFLGALFKKLAAVKNVGAETGKDTTAAQNEVLKQIKQVSKNQGGEPISGKGVTKSGRED